jgi:predicted transcriptional regulator
MEVHFKPDMESRLTQLASRSGRATDDLVEDALFGYLALEAAKRSAPDVWIYRAACSRIKNHY